MIEILSVEEALRPRLGIRLAQKPEVAEPLCAMLRDYAPYRESFSSLAARLEDKLFTLLYNQLGPGMSARMDNGAVRRIRTHELRDIADDLMGVLFDQMKVYSVTWDSLHAYAMETGSFAALRVMYTRYGAFMDAEERKLIARIIRDTRPRKDWEAWLDPIGQE